jgi:RNA 2',3'-cyclic 3'-phosphodiesterase
MENKRLFFGFEIISPWPEELPPGRILLEEDRHLTVAFLANSDLDRLTDLLGSIPTLPFKMGFSGIFDRPVFLPHHSPNVAAWHIRWLEGEETFCRFQKDLASWLNENGFHPRENDGEPLPHVTIARRPFVIHEWKEAFEKRPLFIKNLHLCESLGSSHYKICWSYPVLAPFNEKEHTADIAFTVRGESITQMLLHAELALSFHFPPLVDYFSFQEVGSLDEVIQQLNAIIGKADQEIGSPFKAVSYHGNIVENEILEWEMIVDV